LRMGKTPWILTVLCGVFNRLGLPENGRSDSRI
jgi:hypothetical protein